MRVSIIVPTLDEALALPATLARVASLPGPKEVLVVDAGSRDGTSAVAESFGATVVVAPKRQRAAQLNLGARTAQSEILLFLHADTLLPETALSQITSACASQAVVGGAFARTFDSSSPFLALTTRLAYARNRAFGWHLGDQAIFAKRHAFDTLRGFPDYDRFEDLEFSRRLGRLGRLVTLRPGVVTSSRRFHRQGPFRTTVRDLILTLRYLRGDRRAILQPPTPPRMTHSDTRNDTF